MSPPPSFSALCSGQLSPILVPSWFMVPIHDGDTKHISSVTLSLLLIILLLR